MDATDFTTVLWYAADFLQIIGYTQQQFKEELHSTCSYIHPEDAPRVRGMMESIRQTGQHAISEVRIIRRSGELRIMTITLCYVRGEDSWDGIASYYSVGLDITGPDGTKPPAQGAGGGLPGLLSLINEVLDMSKIETERSISLRRKLISRISSRVYLICAGLCLQKSGRNLK